MPKALAVKLKLHGPITIQYPLLSTAGGSYILPPPSTLIGALYFAYAFQAGNYTEVKEIEDKVCSPVYEWIKDRVVIDATVIPVGSVAAVTNTLLRLFNWVEQGRGREVEDEELYTVGYVGLSYVPELIAIYAVKDEWFNELRRSAWGMIRLGKKEGLVSVTEVGEAEVKTDINNVYVNSYFRDDSVTYVVQESSVQFFPDPYSAETYCHSGYNIPQPMLVKYVIPWGDGAKVGGLKEGYRIVSYGGKYAVLKFE